MPTAADRLAYSSEESAGNLPLQAFKGKISVIIPAYNEQFHIAKALNETMGVFEESGCDYEIIVVDDGSTDKTFQEACRISDVCDKVRVIESEVNGGKGHALKFGFGHVKGDLVVFLDADLDLHPKQIHTLYRCLNKAGADAVIGSKRHPQSRLDYPFHRRIISNTYYYLIKSLFGLPVKDTQTGIKIFKYEVLKDVFPRVLVKRYALDLELLAIANNQGYEIAEAPIVLDFKRRGRIRPIDVYHVLIDTLTIFYRLRISRYYDRMHNEQSSEVLNKYSC